VGSRRSAIQAAATLDVFVRSLMTNASAGAASMSVRPAVCGRSAPPRASRKRQRHQDEPLSRGPGSGPGFLDAIWRQAPPRGQAASPFPTTHARGCTTTASSIQREEPMSIAVRKRTPTPTPTPTGKAKEGRVDGAARLPSAIRTGAIRTGAGVWRGRRLRRG
jgi:hypothetical protein